MKSTAIAKSKLGTYDQMWWVATLFPLGGKYKSKQRKETHKQSRVHWGSKTVKFYTVAREYPPPHRSCLGATLSSLHKGRLPTRVTIPPVGCSSHLALTLGGM